MEPRLIDDYRRVLNNISAMTDPVPSFPELDPNAREKALGEVARVIATGSLTLGSVLLTAVGLVERVVGFDALANDSRFAVLSLMPGAAALAFLASARTIGALYDASVPPRPLSFLGRLILRFLELEGGYGLFALVVSGLVAVSSGLAVALALPFPDERAALAAIATGTSAFLVAFFGMLTRISPTRRILDGVLAMAIGLIMVLAAAT